MQSYDVFIDPNQSRNVWQCMIIYVRALLQSAELTLVGPDKLFVKAASTLSYSQLILLHAVCTGVLNYLRIELTYWIIIGQP